MYLQYPQAIVNIEYIQYQRVNIPFKAIKTISSKSVISSSEN